MKVYVNIIYLFDEIIKQKWAHGYIGNLIRN